MRPLKHPFFLALFCAFTLALTGCVDDKNDIDDGSDPDNGSDEGTLEDCNPAGHSIDCFYPFPSDAFRVETNDGARIEVPEDARVRYGGKGLQFELENPIDGYSIHPPIFADLGETIDPQSVPFHDQDLAITTTADSPVIVLDAETKEAVAHFVELDHNVDENDRTLLQIRLLRALEENTRYIVAIQGVKNTDGEIIQRPQSFDDLAFNDDYDLFEDAQAHTRENILPALEEFGVDLDNLQLAWDFTTRSNHSARHELEHMIAQSGAWMDSNDLNLRIVDVQKYIEGTQNEDAPAAHPYLRYDIRAEIDVPLFLTDNSPNGRMLFDEDGLPRYDETTTLEVDFLIPHTVADAESSDATIQFGHGFFGSTDEMRNSFLPKFLHENNMVSVGIKWWGLSDDDMMPVATKITTDAAHVFNFTERLLQGFVNQNVVARLAQDLPDSLTFEEDPSVDFAPMLQNDRHVFYGISLGHILGSTAIAVSPEIQDGILSVGGGSFSFIMSRAAPFKPLIDLVNAKISNKKDAQKFIALSSLAMEKVDPINYADQLLENTFDNGTIERRILGQVGLGDPDVPTLSALVWARSANIPIGQAAPDWFAADVDVLTSDLPEDKSVMMIFDFDLGDDIPGTYSEYIADSTAQVHGGVRVYPKGQEQVLDLIRNNPISDICDGAVCVVP